MNDEWAEIIDVPGEEPIIIEHGFFNQEDIDFVEQLLAESDTRKAEQLLTGQEP